MPHPEFPTWLHALSIVSLAIAGACAAVVALDEIRRPQPMWIMNLVWPLSALFAGLPWLWFYGRWGRGPGRRDAPMAVAVAKGTSHCGAGCALGDLVAEWLVFAFPAIAVAFGWKTIFPEKTFAAWALDFLLAFALGVGFQYFTIAPMRHLSVGQGLWAAIKADTLPLTAW